MNNQRRKMLGNIISRIEAVKMDLEAVRDEEQYAYDNMPESLQGGERGQLMEEALGYMDEAVESLDEALDDLEEVT